MKMSESSKGKKLGPQSEEHKRKRSEVLKGRILSEETKEKIRKTLKGKPQPAVSETLKRKRWFHNETTGEVIRIDKNSNPPSGFFPGRGPLHWKHKDRSNT